jgi:hypothetical protein
MGDYAIPSSRFQRAPAINQPAPMNFYAPPANMATSQSGAPVQSSPMPMVDDNPYSLSNAPKYYRPAPEAARPGAINPNVGKIQAGLSAVQAGLQNSQTPATTDTETQIASVAGNTLSGAAQGAAAGAMFGPQGAVVGGVIGGGVALVTSGLNAWLGNKQARSERDRQAALLADANRIRQEEIARNEKWMRINNLQSIEAAAEDRRRYNQNQARQSMTDTATKLQAALANNSALREHWARYGFN